MRHVPQRPDALDYDLARQRLKSPHFPTIAEAMSLRQRRRENLAGRLLLAATAISAVYAVVDFPLGILGVGFFGVGFAITAWVAGTRHDARSRRGEK